MKLLIIQSSQFPATSSFLGPNILFSTLFSHIFNLYNSLSVRVVSHPYKTAGKIMVLNSLLLRFIGMRQDDKRF